MSKSTKSESPSRASTVLGLLFVGTAGVGVLALFGAAIALGDDKPGLVPLYLIAAALGFGLSLRSVAS